MSDNSFQLTIHLVCSLDGMIASKDNSISWFESAGHYDAGVSVSDEESAAFLAGIDCYVMGAKTYELALELSVTYGWPYGDKPTLVLTHRSFPPAKPNIEFHSGNPSLLVEQVLKPRFRNVWLAGGASLAREFIRLNLADRLRISFLPVILGDGLRLFEKDLSEQPLDLENVVAYKNAMVELSYRFRK